MLFDQMTKEMMIEEKEFSQVENTDEIVSIIKKKTLDSLEEVTSFLSEFPNPTYAVMRLEYLAESQNEMNYQMLIELYKEKKLVSHLMEMQKRAIQFMREVKPQMMKERNIASEEDPKYQTMISALKEMVIKEVVEV